MICTSGNTVVVIFLTEEDKQPSLKALMPETRGPAVAPADRVNDNMT